MLLRRGVVPVINENDAVADDEIRFGDNDRLAALVAHLIDADRLVLLTDTAGLFTARSSGGHLGILDRGDRGVRSALGGGGWGPRFERREGWHGVEVGGGQDRHLVGGRDP